MSNRPTQSPLDAYSLLFEPDAGVRLRSWPRPDRSAADQARASGRSRRRVMPSLR